MEEKGILVSERENHRSRRNRSITINSPVEDKILWAEEIFQDTDFTHLAEELEKLKEAIERSRTVMNEKGIFKACSECGDKSCCGEGIEQRFDATILILNLLLGVKLPHKREIKHGCFFLSNRGCKLKVREIICINYLCKKIYEEVEIDDIIEVQRICGEEIDLIFRLSEEIKRKIKEGARK